MNRNETTFSGLVIGAFVIVAAGLALTFSRMIKFSSQPVSASAPTAAPLALNVGLGTGGVQYSPPKPADAPKDLLEAVNYGYNLLNKTQENAKAYTGNQLNCTNCHFDAGATQGGKNGGISLVGVWAKYPMYRTRTKYATDLAMRTNECFTRSMNGKPLPYDSKEMQAILAYYAWISKGLPIYAKIPWLGLPALTSTHQPDANAGAQVFANICSGCHGKDGAGTAAAPPLWGQGSFNDGAGMSKPATMAVFAHLNMPKGNPTLTLEQAIDVAQYVDSQPRPKFQTNQ